MDKNVEFVQIKLSQKIKLKNQYSELKLYNYYLVSMTSLLIS